jgi:hypothetical protein
MQARPSPRVPREKHLFQTRYQHHRLPRSASRIALGLVYVAVKVAAIKAQPGIEPHHGNFDPGFVAQGIGTQAQIVRRILNFEQPLFDL